MKQRFVSYYSEKALG